MSIFLKEASTLRGQWEGNNNKNIKFVYVNLRVNNSARVRNCMFLIKKGCMFIS